MLLPSVVHASSTHESGAMLHDCLSLDPQVQFSILHLFWSPMNLLPSTIHVSSTFESRTPRSYYVALFANSPVSTFFVAP